MTQPSLRNDDHTPPNLGGASLNPEPYEGLRRRAQALGHDAGFLALLRRPTVTLSGAVRLALDAVPALELLPLPVLAQELAPALRRARPCAETPVTRIWLA